ncbi:MAG: ribosome-associated translation inhibitor RaiA [Acidobacteria bacterium]|nr:ribosome-associated translation inhibitor RaiA [Acidobacteriota bacterium]
MEVRVSSRRVDLDTDFASIVEDKVTRLDRFVSGLDRAEVHFSEDRHHRHSDKKDMCEITVTGHGHYVRAKVEGPDEAVAFDRALARVERQMRKLKTRLQKRHHGDGETIRQNGDVPAIEADGETSEQDDSTAKIVKAKRFDIDTISPQDAAERMDLVGHDFFFFHNVETGRAAVVYLREDGDIGLIDDVSD